MMMWGYLGTPWGWMGPLGTVLFWLVVIGGAVLLLRSRWEPTARHAPDALAVLRRRYAAGEITREEFTRMRNDLTGRPD